ncbi:D-alanyl-D-alanine-carboxypeptidase/endopeptidase AmpH [Falsiphaeobacter marinintestinus]|uniref:D-alanyl-D-alanine- carboxypeptidase/endopeptidase AmpH n=1 Tax=Falsiphaeobacter marinintestinus TaxID=1492905 RepID=UPI0011B6DDE6|nr:D-alanyl-D-alanine-carboxypeptidase/endopeptidase AmpH [Phaeobacter marinintestinus]
MKLTALITAFSVLAAPAVSEDLLLKDALAFSGQIFHIDTGVPGLVIAAVRNGETAVYGFGETEKGNGQAPDADTVIGVGSITKTFTGLTLANLVQDGTASLTDLAGPFIDIIEKMPEQDGHQIRLIDLATHSAGTPRELAAFDGIERYSDESFVANVNGAPLLFSPGTGVLYSNVGFDLLAMALAGAAGKSYDALLQEQVLDPIKLTATSYARPTGNNVMTGYDWNGNKMDPGPAIPNRQGASQLHTTANDMLEYLKWNLDRFADPDSEARNISHAAWLIRDGLNPVYGLDESGQMDAMGLGWVIMMPDGDRPLILQKAGGTNGVFSYVAFAPNRDVGVFMSINQFNFAAGIEMAELVNDLIMTLAPR